MSFNTLIAFEIESISINLIINLSPPDVFFCEKEISELFFLEYLNIFSRFFFWLLTNTGDRVF